MSRISRRALRAIFFKMKLKGLGGASKPPTTLSDLAKAYKLPKVRVPKPKKPALKLKAPKPAKIKKPKRVKKPVTPRAKQEVVIKIETPKAAAPKKPKPRKPKAKAEAPKTEGAAKEAEKGKTRRERFVEGSEAVSAGETYASAASGLFGFLRKHKKGIKAGAKKAGIAGAEGAVAGGAGTAVYRLTAEEEKKKKRRKKKAS